LGRVTVIVAQLDLIFFQIFFVVLFLEKYSKNEQSHHTNSILKNQTTNFICHK